MPGEGMRPRGVRQKKALDGIEFSFSNEISKGYALTALRAGQSGAKQRRCAAAHNGWDRGVASVRGREPPALWTGPLPLAPGSRVAWNRSLQESILLVRQVAKSRPAH